MLEKYGLDKVGEKLSSEAEQLLVQALKNAENKVTVSTVSSHWKEILIFCLLAASVVMYQRMDSAQKDLAAKQETYERLQKIDTIEKSLQSVVDNQTNLYPQIDATVTQLEAARAQLRALDKKIGVANPATFQAAAKGLSIEDLSKELAILGYKNVIIK